MADVKVRIGATTTTAGKMRAIWASKSIPQKLKMRIYKSGVCSRLTYGSEAWRLDPRTCKMLNGANSRMVARITNRTSHEEASARTQTFDVVRWIRARRLQWVGHILRARNGWCNKRSSTSWRIELLMDIPPTYSWSELQELAANRDGWRSRVNKLRAGSSVTITMNDSLPGRRVSLRNREPAIKTKSAPTSSPSAK